MGPKRVDELKYLEREPIRYYKGDGKITFTRIFLMLGEGSFDEYVNTFERYCKL